jgi:hypothetical protein
MRYLSLVACVVPAAAFAAAPVATVDGDARPVEFSVHGVARSHYRLSRGGSMTLRVSGTAPLELELRCEGLSPKAVAPLVEQDGRAVPVLPVNVTHDPSARSEKGQALSRPTSVPLGLGAGKHLVILRWPHDASGDVLINVKGVQIAAALPDLSLADSGRNPVLLPLPEAPSKTEPVALAPLAMGTPSAKPAISRIAAAQPGSPGSPGFTAAAQPSREQPSADRFELELRAGAQRSSENYTGPSTQGQVGLDFGVRVKPLLPIIVSLDGRFSRQGYQARQAAQDGRGPSHADVDEQRFDAFLGAGYDLGPWLLKSGRLVFMPILGGQYTGIRNSAFPLDLAGVAVGARVRWALSQAFALQGAARWTYNLLKKDTLSVVGSPVSDLGLQAGVSLPLAGEYAFDVGYRGDVLAMHFDTRVSHGVSVGMHAGF